MIKTVSLSKTYADQLVVDDVNVQLAKGGVTSIIGPNGAGKSTLLSMVARLMPMSAGQVMIDEFDVSKAPGDALAKRLSILKQNNEIATRLTVHDLVSFGRYPYSKGRLTVDDKQHIDRSLDFLGLVDLQDRFLDELSGGQRQRAFVAMVMCQDTDYVLLDEPLNNLDMRHAVSMMKLMRQAATEFGKTFVVVLHDINFASCYSDQILVMQNGKLRYHGTPADVITPDIMQEIYEIDVQVHTIAGRLISVYYE